MIKNKKYATSSTIDYFAVVATRQKMPCGLKPTDSPTATPVTCDNMTEIAAQQPQLRNGRSIYMDYKKMGTRNEGGVYNKLYEKKRNKRIPHAEPSRLATVGGGMRISRVFQPTKR